MPDLEADLDALYGSPLEEFVRRRTELARRLRAAGLTDVAADIAKLRKPSRAVWVVNQLARIEPELTNGLVATAGELAAAPSDRGAAEAHREALRRLAGRLTEVDEPLSDSVRQKAAVTLRNASLDPHAREDLARGRLGAERGDMGFELVAEPGLPAERASRRAKKPARSAELERLVAERRVVRAEIATLKAAAKQAAKEATAATREADEAQAYAGELADEVSVRLEQLALLEEQLRSLRKR